MTEEREMNPPVSVGAKGEESTVRDTRLTALLRTWEEPQVPTGLDTRILAAYREQVQRVPLWKQLLSLRVSVPLPVAVAALLLLLLSATFVIRQGLEVEPDVPQVAGSESNTQTARGPDAPVVTQTSLAGFEPVNDVNVLVLEEAPVRQ